MPLNIVLVEPRIPQNTGNIARTCAATGARLHLVEPMGFQIDDAKLKRAGLDYWNLLDITYYSNLDAFFAANPGAYFFLSTKGNFCYTEVEYPNDVFLIFGREDAGLPEPLLRQYRDRCLRLPMREGARSLNLSNAVAVVLYEALRQQGFPELQQSGKLSEENV